MIKIAKPYFSVIFGTRAHYNAQLEIHAKNA